MGKRGMIEQVAEALAAIAPEGTFAAEIACGSEDLRLQVEGVGPVGFPIPAATVRKLLAVSRPAPYGKRDQTLYDPGVRDTAEIEPSRVKIDMRSWRPALDRHLAALGRLLGVPEGAALEASLDKLLIYGPGQFFTTHQDSERGDDMVGTLVVELPCTHEGGAVVVEHQGKRKTFGGAARGARDLSLVAFYADCRHEVKPVTSGYRITLTYHLFQRAGAEAPAKVSAGALDGVAKSVERYFSTKVEKLYSRSPAAPPDRLVYLLDHEYTQKSLGWARLKGADRLRAAALRGAADRLGCEVVLALADVHETWSCEEEWDRRSRWRRYREHEEDDDAVRADGHTLTDLIDTEIELSHFVDAKGKTTRGHKTSAWGSEVCVTRPSVDMRPFQSQHEGYMGNSGNTVDRWYHRAAIVLWPKKLDFAVRAEASPAWAVKEIAARRRAGDARDAHARARELLPFWAHTAREEQSTGFVRDLFEEADALDDADLALALLSPLGPRRLDAKATPPFVRAVAHYGAPWGERLFQAWDRRPAYGSPSWIPSLPGLSAALIDAGEQGRCLARWLLAREAGVYKKGLPGRSRLSERARAESFARGLDDLLALLEAAVVIGAPDVTADLAATLASPASGVPLLGLGALLEKARKGRKPEALRSLGLGGLAAYVAASLRAALAAPERDPSDWSIDPPGGCACGLCKELSTFLRDPARLQLGWPLAKEGRRHVHGAIDAAELPVSHTTVREGSPQTLVLTKLPDLFHREAARRERCRALLGWLEKAGGAFDAGKAPERPAAKPRRSAAITRRRAR